MCVNKIDKVTFGELKSKIFSFNAVNALRPLELFFVHIIVMQSLFDRTLNTIYWRKAEELKK